MSAAATPPPWSRKPDPAESWTLSDPAHSLLRDDRNVVPILGAGMSRPAGLPVAWELAEWLAANSQTADKGPIPDEKRSDLAFVASRSVGSAHSSDETANSDRLRRSVANYIGGFDPKRTVATWALARIASKFIITLNYDLVLELAAADQGIRCRSLTWRDASEALQLLSPESNSRELIVMHMHGSIEDHTSIVLGATEYAELQDRRSVEELWATVARMRRLLFLGVSLDESYVVATLQRVQGGSGKHVLVTDEPTSQTIATRMSVDAVRHGITRVTLPGGDNPEYGKLNGLCWSLTTRARGPASADSRVIRRTDTAKAPFYTPGVLVENPPGEDDAGATLLSEWDFSGSARFRRMFGTRMRHLSEADIATHPHTLIIGEPGVGKTEMLRSVAELVPAGYTTVLLRLADVDTQPGNSALVLSRWAEKGETVSADEVAVDPDALNEHDFHFLLDGLDEVSVANHAAAIQRIGELVDQFPQHRWTITTRPMEGLDAFDAARWQHVRAPATHAWQQAYLRIRGVDWERDIQPHVVGINDARELLRLPFFLARVVEMNDRGALAETRDLWGLLQALVTDALEREAGLITLLPEDARQWLRRVALAMLLVGRSTLTPEEIAQIPLPATTAASHAEVCSILTQRLMLKPTGNGGQVAFTHRMFGACLAAEALDEVGPTPELLDALVPDVSPTLRGARLDAVVPLSLVMTRNAAWRETVGERDRIAAARATPDDAPRPERLEAAHALWSRYEDWGVWIWDRDRPEIAEDASSLARLLAAGDLPEIEQPIRAALTSPEMVQQGNAVEVLSLAGFKDIEPELEAILNNDELQPVVRRQAAVAARVLGLHALLPLIIRRAIDPADDAEAQDCSSVAMTMAIDDEVVDVASQLIASDHRSTRGYALSHLARRADAAAVIKALRQYADSADERFSSESDMLVDAAAKLDAGNATAVRDLAFLAVLWHVSKEGIVRRLREAPVAAAEGAAEALDHPEVYGFQAGFIAEFLTTDQMRAARWPVDLVERHEMHRAMASAPAGATEAATTAVDEDHEDIAPAPALIELLERPRDETTDWVITHNSQYFTDQAKELPDAAKRDLAERLDDWWPDKPYAETITWKPREGSSRGWTQENEAAAWLWYGPAINKKVTPRQWAEILAAGAAPFEDQTDWLAAQYTAEGAALLAELMTTEEVEFWYSAFRAIPPDQKIPTELIEAGLARVREGDAYRIAYLGERMSEAAGAEPLHRLSAVSDQLADALRPVLGALGDPTALEALFADLRSALVTQPHSFDHDELVWLEGVDQDERWLNQLFECLAVAYTNPGRAAGRDALTPLLNTIANVGARHPEQVVSRYDGLFRRDPQCRWLRQRREDIVQHALGAAGLDAAHNAAIANRLPHLPG